jgi:hypothetical protein
MNAARRRWRESPRLRKTGIVACVLFFGTSAVALSVALGYHLSVAQTLTAILIGGGAPAALYLTWAGIDLSLGQALGQDYVARRSLAADELADAVLRQWRAEAQARRLHDPYPLPVRWRAADADLVDSWTYITKFAQAGLGSPQPLDTTEWAASSEALAGTGAPLSTVLARIPTGRLVVLGAAGSGKTMLIVRLTLDLLAARSPGSPVPVLVSASSWDPVAEDLRDWLEARLCIDYPALAEDFTQNRQATTKANSLLEAGLIIPVLDGLDEIPASVRGAAIARINDSLRAGEKLAVTCRTESYREALRPSASREVTLRGAAGIELCPLGWRVLTDYLRADAGGPAMAARWHKALNGPPPNRMLIDVLSSPLMAGLARTIYNARPGEQGHAVPDPAELDSYPDSESIKQHLLDGFVKAAYRSAPQPGSPYGLRSADRAEKRLIFLARHLETNIHGPDIAWWQLARAVPRPMRILASPILAGLAVIAGIETGFAVIGVVYFGLTGSIARGIGLGLSGIAMGLHIALPAGLAAILSMGYLSILARTGWPRWVLRLTGARAQMIAVSLACGLLSVIAVLAVTNLTPALVTGLTVWFLCTISAMLARRRMLILNFRRGWAAAASVGPVVGLITAAIVGNFGGIWFGVHLGITYGIVAGLATGVAAILAGGGGPVPTRKARWNPRRGLLAALAAMLAGGLGGWFLTAPQVRAVFAATMSLAFGVAGAIAVGLERPPSDVTAEANPRLVLRRDRNATVALVLASGLAGTVTGGLISALLYGDSFSLAGAATIDPSSGGLPTGLAFGCGIGLGIGVAVGAVFGLAQGEYGTAWAQWSGARAWLALCGSLPVRLLPFLEDAHQRGALRKLGSVYQFRHLELQQHLSSSHSQKSTHLKIRLDKRFPAHRWMRSLAGPPNAAGKVACHVAAASALCLAAAGTAGAFFISNGAPVTAPTGGRLIPAVWVARQGVPRISLHHWRTAATGINPFVNPWTPKKRAGPHPRGGQATWILSVQFAVRVRASGSVHVRGRQRPPRSLLRQSSRILYY